MLSIWLRNSPVNTPSLPKLAVTFTLIEIHYFAQCSTAKGARLACPLMQSQLMDVGGKG
jgi:hypothetical protein